MKGSEMFNIVRRSSSGFPFFSRVASVAGYKMRMGDDDITMMSSGVTYAKGIESELSVDINNVRGLAHHSYAYMKRLANRHRGRTGRNLYKGIPSKKELKDHKSKLIDKMFEQPVTYLGRTL